jgi:hypothetical protein
MKRSGGQLMGFLLITVAMVVAAMSQLVALPADANGTSFAPAGESRYSAFAQATARPTPTAAHFYRPGRVGPINSGGFRHASK